MDKLVSKFTNKEGGVLSRGVTLDIKEVYRKGVGLAIQFHKPFAIQTMKLKTAPTLPVAGKHLGVFKKRKKI